MSRALGFHWLSARDLPEKQPNRHVKIEMGKLIMATFDRSVAVTATIMFVSPG